MYLGVSLEKKVNAQGTQCWSMSPEKYIAASVLNVEEKLAKDGMKLPTNCKTPMWMDYWIITPAMKQVPNYQQKDSSTTRS